VGGFHEFDGAFAVAIEGDLMAVAAFEDDAVALVDVADPATPRLPGYALHHLAGLHSSELPTGRDPS
jgi:hypothetical protein